MDLATKSCAASKGFTLVEVMISVTLAALLLTAVMSSNIMLLKSQTLSTAYIEMNTQARNGMEIMADDVRQMSAITILATGFSGTVPGSSAGTTSTITYKFDSLLGQVSRTQNNKTAVLWDQVKSCQFSYFGAGTMDSSVSPARMNRGSTLPVGTSTKVKQVQIALTAKTTVLRTIASQQTISAQFTARP